MATMTAAQPTRDIVQLTRDIWTALEENGYLARADQDPGAIIDSIIPLGFDPETQITYAYAVRNDDSCLLYTDHPQDGVTLEDYLAPWEIPTCTYLTPLS